MSLIKYDSVNAQLAGAPTATIQRRYLDGDAEAFQTGVEWHHLAGDVIGFYASTPEGHERVKIFIARCHARAAAAKVNSLGIKSKAAAWRYVSNQLTQSTPNNDMGLGFVPIRTGRYGPFVALRSPEYVYWFQSAAERDVLCTWLKFSALFPPAP